MRVLSLVRTETVSTGSRSFTLRVNRARVTPPASATGARAVAGAASAAAGLFVDSGRGFSAAFVKDIHRILKKSAGNFDFMVVFNAEPVFCELSPASGAWIAQTG